MRSLRIAYNERQEPLEVLLRTVDRPGDYCMQGRLLAPMPRVEVEGARSLSFPITEEQARSLAAAAGTFPSSCRGRMSCRGRRAQRSNSIFLPGERLNIRSHSGYPEGSHPMNPASTAVRAG